jgi:tetratricopeptide (TPR) repeat protein
MASEAHRRAQIAWGIQRPHGGLTNAELSYAYALQQLQRPKDAIAILERAVADRRALDGTETARLQLARGRLAVAYMRAGRLKDALPILRENVRLEAARNVNVSEERIVKGDNLVNALASARLTDEALSEDRRVAAAQEQLGAEPLRWALERKLHRGRLYMFRGEFTKAEARTESVVAQAHGKDSLRESEALVQSAQLARFADDKRKSLVAVSRLAKLVHEPTTRAYIASAAHVEIGYGAMRDGRWEDAYHSFSTCDRDRERAQVEISVRASNCVLGLVQVLLHRLEIKKSARASRRTRTRLSRR